MSKAVNEKYEARRTSICKVGNLRFCVPHIILCLLDNSYPGEYICNMYGKGKLTTLKRYHTGTFLI